MRHAERTATEIAVSKRQAKRCMETEMRISRALLVALFGVPYAFLLFASGPSFGPPASLVPVVIGAAVSFVLALLCFSIIFRAIWPDNGDSCDD